MDAFEKIYVTYKDDIYRFVCKMTNYNYNLSEELLAETFYQAFISFQRFKGACEIKTWLCQIAKNTYSGYVRREIRREHLYERLQGKYLYANGHPPDVGQQTEDRDVLRCIQTVLAECDPRARDIVQYRMYAGLKFQEIAKILDIKEATAKVIFYRTKVFIQNQLKERYDYEM